LITGDDNGGFFFNFQTGAHFYLTENIGAIAEIGVPYLLKIGVSFKF
jgi:hypothetical protein